MLHTVTLIVLLMNILSTVSLSLGTKDLKFIYKNDVGAPRLFHLDQSNRVSCDHLELLKAQKPTIFAKPLLQYKRRGMLLCSGTDSNSMRVRITCAASYPIKLYTQRNTTVSLAVISAVSVIKDKTGYSYFKSFEITTLSMNQAKLSFKCCPVSCSKNQFQSLFEISLKSGLENYPSIFNKKLTTETSREKDIVRKIIYCSLLGSLIIVISIVVLLISLLYQLEFSASVSKKTNTKKLDSERKQTDKEFCKPILTVINK